MSVPTAIDWQTHLGRFGLKEFRPGQQAVIETVMSGTDCLCVMPTGGGKSLCYQLPAIAQPGVTLVISPLIALMKDQVDQLDRLGIAATFINSTLDLQEQYRRLDQMAAGAYHLVYVVPERFRSTRFLDALARAQLKLLAIDEAHCISQWGHDFRPDYLKIGKYRSKIGNPPTIALTATATQRVRADIIERLDLHDPQIYITGFDRPNLFYEVQTAHTNKGKDQALMQFLDANPGSGIIYAATRKRCEEVSEAVERGTKRKCGIYHAGMTNDERHAAQDKFMSGKSQLVVATNAFGMGIDKSDVRFVIHYNLPGSLEAYYQEAGRAGRDLKPAHCLLLFSAADRYIQEFFINSAYPSREVIQQVYEYLCSLDADPIELSLQEIKDELRLDIAPSGVGTCEALLDQAGVLERLESRQNMAIVRLASDVPTMVDFLPPQATVRRKVLKILEKLVGARRHETVYFHPRDVADLTGLDLNAVRRALTELKSLESFDYIPPFRGRALRMLRRDLPFEQVPIDFRNLEARKQAEFDQLEEMIRFARAGDCRQQTILKYFGQANTTPCGRCDMCVTRGIKPQPGSGTTNVVVLSGGGQTSPARPALSSAEEAVRLQAARIALSAVARLKGRFGKKMVVQVLCGSQSKAVTRARLDQLSTHGMLQFLLQNEVTELVEQLLTCGFLQQEEIERFRPLVKLTDLGTEVMHGRATLGPRFDLSPELVKKLKARLKVDLSLPVPVSAAPPSAPVPAAPRAARVEVPVDVIAEESEPDFTEVMTVLNDEIADEVEFAVAAPDVPVHASPAAPHPPAVPMAAVPVATVRSQPLFAPIEVAPVAPANKPAVPTQVVTQAPSTSERQPSHYWTWRLLQAGFQPSEIMQIRGLDNDTVFDHALRAAEQGMVCQTEWFISPLLAARCEEVIGPGEPERIRPLLAKLPGGTRYEQVQWFLYCRKHKPRP